MVVATELERFYADIGLSLFWNFIYLNWSSLNLDLAIFFIYISFSHSCWISRDLGLVPGWLIRFFKL